MGYALYRISQSPGESFVTRLINKYWPDQKAFEERNALHTAMLEKAAVDRHLFYGAPARDYVELKDPEYVFFSFPPTEAGRDKGRWLTCNGQALQRWLAVQCPCGISSRCFRRRRVLPQEEPANRGAAGSAHEGWQGCFHLRLDCFACTYGTHYFEWVEWKDSSGTSALFFLSHRHEFAKAIPGVLVLICTCRIVLPTPSALVSVTDLASTSSLGFFR